MDHTVRILHIGFVTHDVKQFIVTRPDGFEYEPGQGVEIAVDQEGWREEGRPFTPTSAGAAPVLEFTIKGYPDHEGVTRKLHSLKPGAELLMSEAFGTITYRGPGTFVAGGAGVTPFLAILRQLGEDGEMADCRLLFSNKSPADVICEKELRHLMGERLHLTCTERSAPGYDHVRIDRAFLESKEVDLGRPFYLCGPPAFVEELREALEDMGVDPHGIVVEE
jgi:ferredoxin-NADP reductase